MVSIATPGVITRVTEGPETDRDPDVARNGDVVFSRAVARTVAVSSYDLYVTKLGGGEPRRLTSDAGNDAAPRWTPDGQRPIRLDSHEGLSFVR